MKWLMIIFLNLLLLVENGESQERIDNESPLRIDEPLPEFSFNDVHDFARSNLKSSDLKGQYFVLDFFSSGCKSCIASFPEENEVQKEFNSDVQIILVGMQDYYELKNDPSYSVYTIKKMYEGFKKKFNLKLAIAFDSTVYKKWRVPFAPYVVWVDKHGIIKAISGSSDITPQNVRAFINETPFSFTDFSPSANARRDIIYDVKKPFLINGNGGNDTDFLFRSVLAKWNPSLPQYPAGNINVKEGPYKGRIQGIGMDLERLYRLAYFGVENISFGDSLYNSTYNKPILELKTPDLFKISYSAKDVRGVYNYSLQVPPEMATREFLMKVMQKDLHCFFGFNVSIETRSLPYWKLSTTSEAEAKLKTKGGKRSMTGSHAGIAYRNVSINDLLGVIGAHNQRQLIPFINESGINYNIDIDLNTVLYNNMPDIIEVLRKYGLVLEKREKPFKVLVIKDTE